MAKKANKLKIIELPNYALRTPESLWLRSLANADIDEMRALIIKGPPGTGKTFFSSQLAEAIGGTYLYTLCHSGTSYEEWVEDIDVPSVVVGTMHRHEVMKPGVLTRACVLSQSQPVVLCIDELDKTPQRTETLLLDFLQNARVVFGGCDVVEGNPRNIITILTSNAMRELTEPLMRRCDVISMGFLHPTVEKNLLHQKTGIKSTAIKGLIDVAKLFRDDEDCSCPSLQELEHFLKNARLVLNSDEVKFYFGMCIVKNEDDERLANCPTLNKFYSEFYEEVKDHGLAS